MNNRNYNANHRNSKYNQTLKKLYKKELSDIRAFCTDNNYYFNLTKHGLHIITALADWNIISCYDELCIYNNRHDDNISFTYGSAIDRSSCKTILDCLGYISYQEYCNEEKLKHEMRGKTKKQGKNIKNKVAASRVLSLIHELEIAA